MSRRDEQGTALVELTWLAMLLLVPLVYVVLAAFDVQRSSFALSAATRAAGRAFVLAPSEPEAVARARAAASVALADQGLDPARVRLRFDCVGGCLSPGSVVHVAMSRAVPLPLVPDVFGGGAPSVRVEAEHTVPYGTFREDRS